MLARVLLLLTLSVTAALATGPAPTVRDASIRTLATFVSGPTGLRPPITVCKRGLIRALAIRWSSTRTTPGAEQSTTPLRFSRPSVAVRVSLTHRGSLTQLLVNEVYRRFIRR